MSADTQRASRHAGVVYLAALAFTSGTLRVTSWSHTLPWGGFNWLGLGRLCSVSTLQVGERNSYPAMDLGLAVGDNALLALAVSDPSTYRGRAVELYHLVLDDLLRPADEPELVWVGEMSQLRINTGDGGQDGGAIVMRCEQDGRDNRSARSLRLNNAQHQAQWPGDTFLSRIERLSGQPQVWLTRRFQQQ